MTPAPTPPLLTDPTARRRNLSRARRLGPEGFLHRIAVSEVQDRLAEVNKRFTEPAIVTDFPEFWKEICPTARIVLPASRLEMGQHDLIVHAMALHWADDPVGQLVQMRQALRPDGLLIAAFPGAETLHELRSAMAQAEVEITGGLSPRVLPMGELRDLGALLGRAGFALPVADVVGQRVSYRNIRHLAGDLRAMGEGNAMAARLRHPSSRRLMAAAEACYASNFPDPERPGRILASFDLVFLTGWAPAPGQQQPLRRGSAQISLAQALEKLRQE
ncbi:MAG: SAM-dependent methyltransferase [Paracoccus sp. (in: a-proteobacteria)]|nr:SAM-dependent methyltransferase [Paracoccus sp. (in: a-proteobacteria)]